MTSPLFPQLEEELAALQHSHRFRSPLTFSGPSRHHPIADGLPLVSFSSNDYLGLSSHAAVTGAAARCLAEDGFGSGASRLVSGQHVRHRLLEDALANFLGTETVLLFPTGYHTNVGVLSALAGPEDFIASDVANHASLIDGCRLSRARVGIYGHLDADAADAAFKAASPSRRRFLVTESLFSMDGDIAPLSRLAAAAARHGATLVIDEAHALGALGPGGRGLCAEAGVVPHILIGTLGKAFGGFGGFAAGPAVLKAYLVNRARTFIYTTAPPLPVAAAAQAALELLVGPEGEQLRSSLRARTSQLHQRLRPHLPPNLSASSPILPIVLGAEAKALRVSEALRTAGFFVQAIRPPTVPEETSRLRITSSALHTPDEVDRFADTLLRLLESLR